MTADLIVRDVTVVDGTAAPPLPHRDVAIVAGRFAGIVPSGTIPANGARTLDGAGRWLIPGLWESHTHLRGDPADALDAAVARLDGLMAEYLASGITTVVELGGPLDVDAALRELRRRGAGSPGAHLAFAGPSLTGIEGWPLGLHHQRNLVRETGDAQQAAAAVAELAAGGADLIKIIYDGHPGDPDKLPPDALREAVARAHDQTLRVVVHVHDLEDVHDALGAGADGIEHAVVPDGDPVEGGKRLADAFARAGAMFCPTLTIFEQIGRDGDPAYLDELVAAGITTPQERAALLAPGSRFGGRNFPHHPAESTFARYEAGLAILPLMRAAGVPIAAGSDVAVFMARPKALHRELQLLAKGGLTPHEVLVAATSVSARKLTRATSGTIAPGRDADALLLDADPFADVAHLYEARHRAATIRAGVVV